MQSVAIRGWRESDDQTFVKDYLKAEFWAKPLEPVARSYSEAFLDRRWEVWQSAYTVIKESQVAAKLIVFDRDPYAQRAYLQYCLTADMAEATLEDSQLVVQESVRHVQEGLGIRQILAFARESDEFEEELLLACRFQKIFAIPQHAFWQFQAHQRAIWVYG
ncbi:MAG: hypothetical protein ACOVS5_10445 [Oligoflexus sp.]|jgi:hypothetical protein